MDVVEPESGEEGGLLRQAPVHEGLERVDHKGAVVAGDLGRKRTHTRGRAAVRVPVGRADVGLICEEPTAQDAVFARVRVLEFEPSGRSAIIGLGAWRLPICRRKAAAIGCAGREL